MNKRSKFWAVVVILFLAIIAPSFAYADTVTMYVLCSPVGEVNIRDCASSNGNREGWLVLGDTVTVEDTATDNVKREWCLCIDLGLEAGKGWVCAGYLVADPIDLTQYNGLIDASGRVAAYSTIGGERHWLKVGTPVTVYATGGGWAFTNYGYVHIEYISKSAE